MQNFIAVPFKAEGGLLKAEGIAKFSPAGIVLEFEAKYLGLIGDGISHRGIALDNILDVKFRKGFFKAGARIEIRLSSLIDLGNLPKEEGRIALKVARADFDLASEAVARMNECLAEARSGPPEALPPQHTPVSVLFDESEAETEDLRKND